MPVMVGNGRQEIVECAQIVNAVLRALRGDCCNSAGSADILARHVRDCNACAERVARLGQFVRFMLHPPVSCEEASSPPESNRRRHRRLATNEAVNLVRADGNVVLARLVEVSANGAKLESPQVMERDDTFTLNRGRRSIRAAVRHCSPDGNLFLIGVEYIRTSTDA